MHQTKIEGGTYPLAIVDEVRDINGLAEVLSSTDAAVQPEEPVLTLPPLFTNRKARRARAAAERRIARRMMRSAYRELRTLRRQAGYPEWRTNPQEQG